MAHYSIKDVEVLCGVRAHTLRAWEQRYDFLKPQRTSTNIRYYDDAQLRMLLNISTLNKKGLRISKIAEMSEPELNAELLKTEDSNKPDELIDSLVKAMIDFDELRFEKTLATGITRLGFEKAFSQLVFPFMKRTGVLWAAGSIKPAQEHFVSNLLRRKISAAIDSIYIDTHSNTKRYLLFLPEGETHELLLLFTEYILRARGHHVTYLGPAVPISDIGFLKSVFKPDVLVVYFTIALSDLSIEQYVQQLSQLYPDNQIIIGGSQLRPGITTAPNITIINSLDELNSVIA